MKRGRQLLRDWIERAKFATKRDAARYLGWDEAYLNRVMSENEDTQIGTLGLDNALHLQKMCGIPVDAWSSSRLDESDRAVMASGSKRKIS